MKSKVLIRTALAAALISAIPLTALAVSAATPAINTLTAAAQAQRLTNLKTRGTAEIDRRLANLNAALTKLATSTKLAAADKTTLTQQAQTEITGLTNLKTKLATDTDLTTARTDIQSIVSDYRVYVLMLPKVRLAAALDRFDLVYDRLATLQSALQIKVTAAKTAGKDTTAMQASLTDLTAKTTAAKSKTDGLTAQLLALQPTDYNADHTVLSSYRDTVKAAQTDLKTARDDAKSVIDAFKALK